MAAGDKKDDGDKRRPTRPRIDNTIPAGAPPKAEPVHITGISETMPAVKTTEDPPRISETMAAASPPIPAQPRPAVLGTVARDQYEILGEFARGGLGRILKARDLRSGRVVAIKEILRGNPETRARFAFEALITANLEHPSTVPVYEVGRWPSGDPFYAMKLVSGRSLETVVAESRDLPGRLALVPNIIAVAEALAYAHSHRIIHRDLKPANILVGEFGETVVIDWGLAKNLTTGDEADTTPTAAMPAAQHGETIMGTVLGTPSYMSPEQARGQPVDERTDVYAIGSILYHALSGVRPFADAATPQAVLDAVVVKPPRPLQQIDALLPAELVTIVEKAMAPRAADRYPTAKELAEDLKRFTTGKLVAAHHYSLWALLRRFVRQNRAVVTAVLAALVLGAVFGVFSVRRIVAERNRAEAARADAEKRLAELYSEQGRQALAAKDPDRALTYLAEAMRHGDTRPSTRFLAGQSLLHIAPLTAVLPGHNNSAYDVEWSADGRELYSAGMDGWLAAWNPDRHALVRSFPMGFHFVLTPDAGTIVSRTMLGVVMVWDAHTFAPRASMALPAHENPWALAVSPDGQVVALGGEHGSLGWWHADGTPMVLLPHLADKVYTVQFSPDGQLVLAALTDGTVRLFDLDGTPEATFHAHLGPAWDAEFSPDGSLIVSSGDDATAEVWDTRMHVLHATLVGHDFGIDRASFDPSGSFIATGSLDSTVRLWDAATGESLHVMKGHSKNINALRFSPDGATLASGGEDGSIKLWDVATGALVHSYLGSTSPVSGIAFSPDGTRIAEASYDYRVRVWRADLPPEIIPLPAPPPVIAGDFNPAGTRVATVGKDHVVRVWDAVTGAPLLAFKASEQYVSKVEYSPDGKTLATPSVEGVARLWDANTGALVRTFAHAGKVRVARFDRSGARLLTVGEDKKARVWNVATGALELTLDMDAPGWEGQFSPDGTRIAVSTSHNSAFLWDAADGQRIQSLWLPGDTGWEVAFSPDSKLFAVASSIPPIRVFRSSDGGVQAHLVGHQPIRVSSVAFSPDSSKIVTASEDTTARVWDAVTGEQLAVFTGGAEGLFAARFRPDGNLVAIGGVDKHVAVWDIATGRELANLADVGTVYNLRYSPDGSRILLLRFDVTAGLWQVPDFQGSAEELEAIVRCTSPWRIDGSALAPAMQDPTACR